MPKPNQSFIGSKTMCDFSHDYVTLILCYYDFMIA
jgi:hypothetical protein